MPKKQTPKQTPKQKMARSRNWTKRILLAIQGNLKTLLTKQTLNLTHQEQKLIMAMLSNCDDILSGWKGSLGEK